MTGFGIVGLGDPGKAGAHDLQPLAIRHDWCAANDHPGHTFNPWSATTRCLCGVVHSLGNTVAWPKSTDCGGPLSICNHQVTP